MFAVSAPVAVAAGAQGVQSSSIYGYGVVVSALVRCLQGRRVRRVLVFSAPSAVSAAAQCVQCVDVGVMVLALFLVRCLWMRKMLRVLGTVGGLRSFPQPVPTVLGPLWRIFPLGG